LYGWTCRQQQKSNAKRLSVNDILFFHSASEAKNEALKVAQMVSQFYLAEFFQSIRWFWNEPVNKLPPAMKHVA